MDKRYLNPDTIHAPVGAYSHAVDAPAGRMVFIAGQVGLDANGELVGKGDLAAQAEQALNNVIAALEAAGATWADVVKTNYYVRDVKQVGALREVRARLLGTENPPASTLVEVSSLVSDDFLIEIDAVAIV
jgi:reactive intermediate/imine deaminase